MNLNDVIKEDVLKLVDFAEKTNQLNHVDGIIGFYKVSYNQHHDKARAMIETMNTYDLSWHPEYKDLFKKYYEEKK